MTQSGMGVQGREARGLRDWKEFVSGFFAGQFSVFATYPIHKTMFRQVVHHISVAEALRQLRREGSLVLYRGVLPPLIHKSITSSIMFGTYSKYSRILTEKTPLKNQTLIHATAALLAGSTEAMLAPLERVQVLMQDSKNHHRFKNTIDALTQIGRYHGIAEYYRGLTAILIRNGPSSVLFFTARERLSVPEASVAREFAIGACVGSLISTAFYPLNVVRTHMMITVGGSFASFFSVFSAVLAERGVAGMFKGVHANYTRSFIGWGITNLAYERILSALKRL